LPGAYTFAVTAAAQNGSAVRDLTVSWGDGNRQDLGAVTGTAVVSHVYSAAGTYTIVGTITDAAGNMSTVSTAVSVIPVPRPTIIISFSSSSFIHPATVNFNIQITAPQGVGIEDVLIDFGDGTTSDVGGATGSLPPIQHVYQNGGTFTVRVTVTDSTGTVTTGTTVITIS
jgi:PKD repeat protein